MLERFTADQEVLGLSPSAPLQSFDSRPKHVIYKQLIIGKKKCQNVSVKHGVTKLCSVYL